MSGLPAGAAAPRDGSVYRACVRACVFAACVVTEAAAARAYDDVFRGIYRRRFEPSSGGTDLHNVFADI